MSALFLTIAGVISAYGLWNHYYRGERMIVAPMLATDLHHVPKHTHRFAWHWGSVTMAVLTFSFFAAILWAAMWPLAMVGSVYAFALGLLSFQTMRREKFRIGQMPQWIVFWPIAISGLLGWAVF